MTIAPAPWTWLPRAGTERPASHALHAGDRLYPETSCYMDVIIELLHARGADPVAMLGSTVATDFEGDQWTFLKPSLEDLRQFHGIDVHEMQPYRSWPRQIAEQLAAGRTMIIEADAFNLPDTGGVSYRREHVKSSIAIAGIAPDEQRLSYFHNRGCHALQGEDYRRVLRTDPVAPGTLPVYAELVRFDAGEPLQGPELRAAAHARLGEHLRRRPVDNPFGRLGAWIDAAWETTAGDEPRIHERIFATARMAGAAAELAAAHVTWVLDGAGAAAADAFTRAAEGCKLLGYRMARGRPFDAAPLTARLAGCWEQATDELDRIV